MKMVVSYKNARRLGSGIILVIIIGIGSIPSLMLSRFLEHSSNVSSELFELEKIVELQDLFNESETLFNAYLEGEDVEPGEIIRSMDEVIRISEEVMLVEEEESREEQRTLRGVIENAKRFKTAVAAISGEAEYDPTSDNRQQFEKLASAALADVDEAVSYFMRDINEDIQAANDAMREVLHDGRMTSLAGLISGLIGGFLAIILINSTLNRRLAEVVDGTRKIARGELAHRIPVESDDEIGRLGYFFNTMAADLQKREEELKVNRNLYQTLVDNIGLGITLTGKDFDILMINATQRELTRTPLEQMVGGKCYRKFRNRDGVCNGCPGRRAMRTGRPERIERVRKGEDGSDAYMTITAFPVFDLEGRVEGFVEVAEDVTDRKRAEKALRKSEEKHRAILEDMRDGYYELDLRGNFTFSNRAIREILGRTPEGMDGLSYRAFVDDRDVDKVIESFRHVFETGEPGREVEYRITTKDGDVKTIETSIYVVTDEEGEKTGFRGVSRDVTEKRALETNLLRADKMEAVGTLAGGVAHDLNNILSGIVSYPELLLMDLPGDSPLRNPILTIKKSGEKAAAIVQDLLTLARRGVAVKEAADLNAIVTDYLKSPEFGKLKSFHPDVRFEIALDPTLSHLLGSPIHLTKTVMNLVSNAAEAIPGEGEVRIGTENITIGDREALQCGLAPGDYVVLRIRDTGAGISPEDQRKIFEPFYTKKIMGRSGTGLGMAVVWGAVKDHDGCIDVKSGLGEGSTFTLYFPATGRTPSEMGKSGPSIEAYKGRGESILVVDDSPEQREIASGILKRLGYSVETAPSGEAAVAHLESRPTDLLLLDMIMDPGIDGLETYKRIIASRPGQKAIIASGFSETERVREAERLGAGGYIKKPYTLEKIGMAVRKELDGNG